MGILASHYCSFIAMEAAKNRIKWGELTQKQFNAIDPNSLSVDALTDYNIELARFNAEALKNPKLSSSSSGSSISSRSDLTELNNTPNSDTITPVPATVSLQIEPIVQNNTSPTIDFKASEMTLRQLQELDDQSLTPRSRESLASRIEDLKTRPQGLQEGNLKGDDVDSKALQNIGSVKDMDAHSAGHAADLPAPRSINQDKPATLGEQLAGSDTKKDGVPHAPLPTGDSKLVTILEVAGVALAIWTTAEVVLAYKNVSQEEWDNAKRVHNKIDLLARKTVKAMFSRPGQGVSSAQNILKKMMPERNKPTT